MRASLSLTAETVTGETIERGQVTVYTGLDEIGGQTVAAANLTEVPDASPTFSNLTAGDLYTVEVDPQIFPATNFSIEAGQTEEFTAEVGYELKGAETYTTDWEVRELSIDDQGQVYGSMNYSGKQSYRPGWRLLHDIYCGTIRGRPDDRAV